MVYLDKYVILTIKKMKYKKQIATTALAISLLVGGTNVFAATPQDLGIKNITQSYQKQNKDKGKEFRKQHDVVGVVSVLTSTGFTLNVKNLKTKKTSSTDILTNSTTTYKKDGLKASETDLLVGQKVVVTGTLDTTTSIFTAKTVKIVTKISTTPKSKNKV